MPNYSFEEPGEAIPDGSVIDAGNFTQAAPGTEILKGKTLTINGGNWTNVKKQPEWTVNGGNWTQIERCSHLHPRLLDKGLIPACSTECSHMVEQDEIYVDGVLIDTVYHYEDQYA